MEGRLVSALAECGASDAAVDLVRTRLFLPENAHGGEENTPHMGRDLKPVVAWLVERLLTCHGHPAAGGSQDALAVRKTIGLCGLKADVLVPEGTSEEQKPPTALGFATQLYLMARIVSDAMQIEQAQIDDAPDSERTPNSSAALDDLLFSPATLSSSGESATTTAMFSKNCGLARDSMTAARAVRGWSSLSAHSRPRKKSVTSQTLNYATVASVARRFDTDRATARDSIAEMQGQTEALRRTVCTACRPTQPPNRSPRCPLQRNPLTTKCSTRVTWRRSGTVMTISRPTPSAHVSRT
jgi:hypothetical protein